MQIKTAFVLLPAFLVCQAGAVYWIGAGERVPPKPDFARFPALLSDWSKTGDELVEPGTVQQLGADGWLYSDYLKGGTAVTGSLFVAWFQSQRGGASQPHSPQVCLPGAGWTFDRSEIAPLETSQGRFDVNQDVISLGPQRAAVVYWYQTPRHVMASEWSAKFWTVADGIRDRRTDTALVRIVVFNDNRSDEDTIGAARELAKNAYPALRATLPN